MMSRVSDCFEPTLNQTISLLNLMRSNLPALIFLLRAALASPYIRKNVPIDTEPVKPGSSEFWSKVIISVLLVLAGGVFAG